MKKYFAYGSNMDDATIASCLHQQPKVIGISALLNYKFSYNKKSIDGTGKANIYPCDNAKVYGLVYEVTEEQMKQVDKKEKGYDRLTIELMLDDKKTEVITYTAKPARIDNTLQPSPDYKNKVIRGAYKNNLPVNYIKKFL